MFQINYPAVDALIYHKKAFRNGIPI